MQLSTETGLVLNGSYIVFSCINGYVNMAGSLNVTCSASGTWSPFPNCVSSSGSGLMTTTTMAAGNNQMTTTTMAAGNGQMTTTMMSGANGSPCLVDTTTTFNITNGYLRTMSLLYTTNTTATGN
jgi:hypothetical protein